MHITNKKVKEGGEVNNCASCEEEFERNQYNFFCDECGDKAYAELWESAGDVDESEVVWI